jgi:signal transduction histidine kinase
VTRRILGGFLGVLAIVIVAVVVPLGVIVTGQQVDDFRSGAHNAGQAIGAVAEEHLDDQAPLAGLTTVLSRFAAGGDRVVVLDATGHVFARTKRAVPAAVLSAAKAGRQLPSVPDAVTVSAPVGDRGRLLGVAVLVRGTEPLDHRQAVLWATLATAAGATLVVGALVGISLSRWIGRPLTALAGAAHGIGAGDLAVRADQRAGPPQVRELAGAFNEMADRVATLLEVQRGMTAEVSHQLRTPLAALRLRLELLASEVDTTSADDVLAMVDEANRLSRLVDGLLAVARAEAIRPAPAPIDVRELAEARLDAWLPVAGERGIELRLDAQDAVAAATPGHVEQILDNLLDNALEAVPEGGQVIVAVRTATDGVRLSVADDGPGMTAERRAHALDRFVTDRAGRGGTGLGLAVVRRLVAADHGSAELSETPGGGLTVEITLPSG